MSISSSRIAVACLALVAGLGARSAAADQTDAGTARALAEARAIEGEVVRVVDRVRGAAVTVIGRRPRRSGGGTQQPLQMGGVGSGVVISWRGTWVLTNHHVIDEEQRVEAVTPDGGTHQLRLRATDPRSDLALLSFATRVPASIRPVPLEHAGTPEAREGTWVVATGNPFFLALDGTGVATLGVVSGIRPPDPEAYLDVPTLQHDAEINPGSSGGALWTLHGELLGINGTIATRARRDRHGGGPAHTGASFSVPIAAVRRFLASTLGPAPGATASAEPPRTRSGGLGVSFRTTTDRSGRPTGALVSQVARGSPAAPAPGRAGLRAGDLVTSFTVGPRQYRIRSAADVESAMRLYPAGTPVSVRFYRSGRAYAWSGHLAVR